MRRAVAQVQWLLLAIVVVLAPLSYGYVQALNHDGARVVSRTTPARRPPLTARSVWLVVLDGLRVDTSRTLPALNRLRRQGFDGVSTAEIPSLSRPAYTSMASGAPPSIHGIRTNSWPGAVRVDSVFAQARAASAQVNGAANLSWWEGNHGHAFDAWHVVGGVADSAQMTAAIRRACAGFPRLGVVHLIDVDREGHSHGVGPRYQRAAERVDRGVANLLSHLDLSRDAVIVTADHGHRLHGGHGGPEPEVVRVPVVAAGQGIRRGSGRLPSICGIAPSLAELSGLPAPQSSTCDPFGAMLERKDNVWRQRYHEQQTELAAAADAQVSSGNVWRLSRRAFALLVVFVAGAVLWRGVRRVGVAGWLPVLYWVTTVASQAASGWPFSFSAIVTPRGFMLRTALFSVLALAAYWLALLRLTRGKSAGERQAAWRAAAWVGALVPLGWWAWFGYRQPLQLAPPWAMYFALFLGPWAGGFAFVAWCADVATALRGSAHNKRA